MKLQQIVLNPHKVADCFSGRERERSIEAAVFGWRLDFLSGAKYCLGPVVCSCVLLDAEGASLVWCFVFLHEMLH